jgi:hypothetical protein
MRSAALRTARSYETLRSDRAFDFADGFFGGGSGEGVIAAGAVVVEERIS